jgi:hypothetical protein
VICVVEVDNDELSIPASALFESIVSLPQLAAETRMVAVTNNMAVKSPYTCRLSREAAASEPVCV